MTAPTITAEDVAKSYEVLALLATCELALGGVRREYCGADADNIGAALSVAHRLAGEVHDVLEAQSAAGDGKGGANV